jgi:exodeoxyribonuclease V alpha subunit
LTGLVVAVPVAKPGSGWALARVIPGATAAPVGPAPPMVLVVGVLPGLAPGVVLEAHGRWRRFPGRGTRFVVSEGGWAVRPAAEAGEGAGADAGAAEVALAFLGSGPVPGVGTRLAARIVAAFGEETAAVVAEAPWRLTEVGGVGEDRAAAIAAAWAEGAEVRAVMAELRRRGRPARLGAVLARRLGRGGLDRFRADPEAAIAQVEDLERERAEPVGRNRRAGGGRAGRG